MTDNLSRTTHDSYDHLLAVESIEKAHTSSIHDFRGMPLQPSRYVPKEGTDVAQVPQDLPSTSLNQAKEGSKGNITFADLLSTVGPSGSKDTSSRPLAQHPFASGFEVPPWKRLGVHVLLCILAYPALLVFTLIARNRTLFWTRFIISAGCGLVGFALGYSLIQIGRRILAACAWATVIHQSRQDDDPGVRLKDLAAHSEDPTSFLAALRLLWNRFMYTGTRRRARVHYDNRRWSLYLFYFLFLIVAAAGLPFIFGRIVSIDTTLVHQHEKYREIPIKGSLSSGDIANAAALNPAFNNYVLTWTLSPFSTHGGLPPVASFSFDNDRVYLSETISSQLTPDGHGFGTFDANTTRSTPPATNPGLSPTRSALNMVTRGTLIRLLKWGIRMQCMKITDPLLLVTRSPNDFSYIFTPHTVLEQLFSRFNMKYPREFIADFLTSGALRLNDTLPTGLRPEDIAFGSTFYHNGVGHSFYSIPVNQTGFNGWISLETVLVRLNTTFTPRGKFLKQSDAAGPDGSRIGYDGGVCVQLFEPYVVETYNSSFGAPTTLGIVERYNKVRNGNYQIQERMIGPQYNGDAQRALNSTGLYGVYVTAHTNSINQLLKDNGRDYPYVPAPTVISYTGGSGPEGYSEFSAEFFADARATSDATNILPYFVGTGSIVARAYEDEVNASAKLESIELVIALAVFLVLGVTAAMFVPRLPAGVPRRGFEIYSWLAAFDAEELVGTDPGRFIQKNMELQDIEARVGDLRFRHTAG